MSPPSVDALDELVRRIRAARDAAGRPIVVGISGYGGAGKSTLARALAERVPGALRLRGDDFLDPVRSHRPSDDWDGVERDRLRGEVLDPFRAGRRATFRRFDWSRGVLTESEVLPDAEVLIVDLVGLFHPQLRDALDLAVWVDVDLEVATERGMRRDLEAGQNHAALWRDAWVPTECSFDARHRPRENADVVYRPRRRDDTGA